jgi:hypothetical protein
MKIFESKFGDVATLVKFIANAVASGTSVWLIVYQLANCAISARTCFLSIHVSCERH